VISATKPTQTDKPNVKIKELIFSLFPLIIATGFVTGCASDNYKKGASTAAALTKSSDMITKGNICIDESLANLNDLVSNPNPDLRKQFKAFNASVNDLGSTTKDVANKAEEMKSQGMAYFAKWDEEAGKMRNEDIRNRSEARKHEVVSRFERISQQYDETQIAFQPFMSDLRDVQRFLATDLTAGGLAAIREAAAKANRDAVPVKASLGRLSEEYQGLGIAMSPTVPAR
jgi:hypothetical protein